MRTYADACASHSGVQSVQSSAAGERAALHSAPCQIQKEIEHIGATLQHLLRLVRPWVRRSEGNIELCLPEGAHL